MKNMLLILSTATLAAALQIGPVARQPTVQRRALLSPQMKADLVTPATVGDAKVVFQANYGKPVGVTAQGFVQEMMTSTQFALIAPSYEYSKVFAVGYEKLCSIFLQGCPNDADRESIRSSMSIALGMDPAKMKSDAEGLVGKAGSMTEEQIFESEDFKKIIAKDGFKYTYSFGAGLICLMEAVGVEPNDEAIDRWMGKLGLRSNAFKRDYAYFLESLKKMEGVKEMMLQNSIASKRKEAERLAEKAAKAAKEAEAAEEAEKAAN